MEVFNLKHQMRHFSNHYKQVLYLENFAKNALLHTTFLFYIQISFKLCMKAFLTNRILEYAVHIRFLSLVAYRFVFLSK